MLCTCSPRGSPLSQEAERAPQCGKVVVQHPTFFTSTPLQTPRGPLSAMATPRGLFRRVRAGYAPTPLHGDPRQRIGRG
eukprot:3453071-Prymnesium_polylepis.1